MHNKTNLLFFFIISSLVYSVPSFLFAQSDQNITNNVLKVKSTTDFVITGDGQSANWQNTSWINLPQHNNNELKNAGWNIPAQSDSAVNLRYKTEFKILYSDHGFYCLFKCEDSVITATLKGDFLNLFNEDVVEVFLRPDTTIPFYFEYELSPLNYELAILILNNKGKMMAWKPWQFQGSRKTRHAVIISDKNLKNNRLTWTAELFIPFALLGPIGNVPPATGTKWRANFYRIDYDRNPAFSGWQLTRESFHDPEKFGILEFE